VKTYKQLREKYVSGNRTNTGDYFEVFVNPSRKEVTELGEVLRGIILDDKVYLTNGIKSQHYFMKQIIKGNMRKIIAFTAIVNGKTLPMNLSIAEMSKTEWKVGVELFNQEKIMKVLENNKYLNRMFSNWSLSHWEWK